MKQSMLKRALLTACLSVSMAGVAMAGPVGPVIIPQAGDVVVINHGPDMTFTGNINFDVESQTNNNLQVGSTVIPNVVYGAAFNKTGAPDLLKAAPYTTLGITVEPICKLLLVWLSTSKLIFPVKVISGPWLITTTSPA